MKNILNFLAAMFLLTLLLAAQLTPASPLFWVASQTLAFTILRYAVVLTLLWFIIRPPKTKWLRMLLGLATFALATWLTETTYQGSLGFIDFLTLTIATIALFTALLESKPKDEEFISMRLLLAIFSWASDRIQIASSWLYQFGWLVMTNISLLLEDYYKPVGGNKELELTRGHQRQHA